MEQIKTAKVTVHAGGGWEGHVVYSVTHPDNKELRNLSSNLEEAVGFCKKHNLSIDQEFLKLVKNNLVYESKLGFVIPIEFISDHHPITSASAFLKERFANYY